MSDAIMEKARETAGYRERYAMDNYTIIQKRKENGHKLLTFYIRRMIHFKTATEQLTT